MVLKPLRLPLQAHGPNTTTCRMLLLACSLLHSLPVPPLRLASTLLLCSRPRIRPLPDLLVPSNHVLPLPLAKLVKVGRVLAPLAPALTQTASALLNC